MSETLRSKERVFVMPASIAGDLGPFVVDGTGVITTSAEAARGANIQLLIETKEGLGPIPNTEEPAHLIEPSTG